MVIMFDWLRKRRKQRKIKNLDYLINLEKGRQIVLKQQIEDNLVLKKDLKKKEQGHKIYASKSCAFITTETDIVMKPIKVLDDHKIKISKKEVQINPQRPAHILTLPLHQIIPTRLGRIFSPRVQRYRVYTVQQEGEITHDPHDDKIDEEDKMKLEAVLKLAGAASKADIAKKIMAGLKDALGFWNYFRDVLYIIVIVLMILAFQVLPAMK